MISEEGFKELATEKEKLEKEEADDPVNVAEAEEHFEVREERKERRGQRDRWWTHALKRLTGRRQNRSKQ